MAGRKRQRQRPKLSKKRKTRKMTTGRRRLPGFGGKGGY